MKLIAIITLIAWGFPLLAEAECENLSCEKCVSSETCIMVFSSAGYHCISTAHLFNFGVKRVLHKSTDCESERMSIADHDTSAKEEDTPDRVTGMEEHLKAEVLPVTTKPPAPGRAPDKQNCTSRQCTVCLSNPICIYIYVLRGNKTCAMKGDIFNYQITNLFLRVENCPLEATQKRSNNEGEEEEVEPYRNDFHLHRNRETNQLSQGEDNAVMESDGSVDMYSSFFFIFQVPGNFSCPKNAGDKQSVETLKMRASYSICRANNIIRKLQQRIEVPEEIMIWMDASPMKRYDKLCNFLSWYKKNCSKAMIYKM